mmetsp:Transcript_27818/g.81408  ORF Transcript_27818/g.81408 Transcript_27818/m.81408 type:complete len:263 (-) Transcript_27818:355-1143(-)
MAGSTTPVKVRDAAEGVAEAWSTWGMMGWLVAASPWDVAGAGGGGGDAVVVDEGADCVDVAASPEGKRSEGFRQASSLGGVHGWDWAPSVCGDRVALSSDSAEPLMVPSLSRCSVLSSRVKSQGWSNSGSGFFAWALRRRLRLGFGLRCRSTVSSWSIPAALEAFFGLACSTLVSASTAAARPSSFRVRTRSASAAPAAWGAAWASQIKVWERSSRAVGRSLGSRLRHWDTKSLKGSEYFFSSSSGGGFLGIRKSAFMGCVS